jgi:UDP-glucose 4-epimerase
MNTPYECLGSKQGWTVREVIKTMKEVTGVNFDVLEGERRLGDSVANTVDTLSDYITLTKTIEDMCIDQYKLEISRNS